MGYYIKDRKWHHDGNCDSCGKELKKLEGLKNTLDTYIDTLIIQFDGSYGSYLDITSKNEEYGARFCFCKECADKLLEENPVFSKVFSYCKWNNEWVEEDGIGRWEVPE